MGLFIIRFKDQETEAWRPRSPFTIPEPTPSVAEFYLFSSLLPMSLYEDVSSSGAENPACIVLSIWEYSRAWHADFLYLWNA